MLTMDVPMEEKPDASLANGLPRPVLMPFLLEPLQSRAAQLTNQSDTGRSTPGLVHGMEEQLVLETTTEDDSETSEDSLANEKSEASEEEEQNPIYGLPVRGLPTGLCYDIRMRYHAEVAAINENNVHPEDPRRIYYIFKELCEAGLVDDGRSSRLLVPQPLLRIDAREATKDECLMVHTVKMFDFLESTKRTPLESSELLIYGSCLSCATRSAQMALTLIHLRHRQIK